MKIKDNKCKCGHNDFFFADKGNQKGIYCSYCGKWLKWAGKDEQNLAMKQEPILDKIKSEIENHCGLAKEEHCKYCSYCNNLMGVREILEIIDKYKAELKGETYGDKCDNDHDCEHCDWVECIEMKGEQK